MPAFTGMSFSNLPLMGRSDDAEGGVGVGGLALKRRSRRASSKCGEAGEGELRTALAPDPHRALSRACSPYGESED